MATVSMMIDFYAIEIVGKIGDYVVITKAMGVELRVMVMMIISPILSCR